MFIEIIFLAFGYYSANASDCGVLQSGTGVVEVLRLTPGSNEDDRKLLKAQIPQSLECEDVVITRKASRAKLKLPQTIITLNPNSRIALAKYKTKASNVEPIELTYGKMRAAYEKSKSVKQEIKFRVKTASAVAGVRGTDFYIEYDPNTNLTTQATLSGKVEVQNIQTQQTVEVLPGKQVDIVKEQEKPIEVKEIEKDTIVEIQQTSALAKNEELFQSKEAIEIVGTPEKWVAPVQEMPEEFESIKNEF